MMGALIWLLAAIAAVCASIAWGALFQRLTRQHRTHRGTR